MVIHSAPPNITIPLAQGSFEILDLAGNRIALFDGVNRKLTLPNGATIDAQAPIPSAEGLAGMGVAHAVFDPSGDESQRTATAHGLGVTIPSGAVVVGGFVDVETTFTSGDDSATIAISIQGANDIRSAVAISTGTSWDAGRQAIIPKANTPESTSILLTADREITATVAVQALVTGKAHIYLYYVRR